LFWSARFPSALEAAGAVVGFSAAVFIIVAGADPGDGPRAQPATLLGDLTALLCAASFCCYISISAVLREAGTPTFLLLLPANAVAAALLAAVLLASGTPACCAGAASLVDGWASSSTTFWLVIGMGVIPGLLGHGLMTVSLAVVAPLIVSLIGLNQVWLVVVFGAAVGAQGMPSVATLAAAPILAGAAALAIVGSERAKRRRAALQQCDAAAAAAAPTAPAQRA
jgi:drug/metabolite transporter (DMT)-like permease